MGSTGSASTSSPPRTGLVAMPDCATATEVAMRECRPRVGARNRHGLGRHWFEHGLGRPWFEDDRGRHALTLDRRRRLHDLGDRLVFDSRRGLDDVTGERRFNRPASPILARLVSPERCLTLAVSRLADSMTSPSSLALLVPAPGRANGAATRVHRALGRAVARSPDGADGAHAEEPVAGGPRTRRQALNIKLCGRTHNPTLPQQAETARVARTSDASRS